MISIKICFLNLETFFFFLTKKIVGLEVRNNFQSGRGKPIFADERNFNQLAERQRRRRILWRDFPWRVCWCTHVSLS